jgi:crotonobetainyl-CoA:carnitine CoA-transferase CaiB-like acyl-CoA transferase
MAPLTGVRVIEVGNFMAAPFCGMQLADLGADVVKVENPDGGDFTRLSGPYVEGESSGFIRLNRNKRSLALDFKPEAGKAAFKRLVAHADVILENLRPGAMRELGFGYEALALENPNLIYVSASGWGQDGPYAALPGLDIMAQARGGLMSITGEEGGPPVKVGVPVTDLACGLYGALAVVAALYARRTGGGGQFIDVSLFESGVSLAVWEAGQYFGTGEVPRRHGSAHQRVAPYQAFRSSDGYFTAGATTPKTWPAFCKTLALTELENDPRFDNPTIRLKNRPELVRLIEDKTIARTSKEWVDALNAVGVPAAPILDFAAVFTDPHLHERGFFADVPHRKLGPVRVMRSPMRFSSTKTAARTAGPMLGEHSHEVLRDYGFGDDEIAALESERVIAAAEATADV